MSPKQKKFQYTPSRKISHWGCHFDSLTELKYAISIVEEYEFLRERVAILYHHGTTEPTEYLRGPFRRYRPDFLIRHKVTGEAFLIEVKPRAYEGHPQLALRTELAEKYIKWKKFDWKFKVVFDDQIQLSAEQLEDFNDCCRMKSKTQFRTWFDQYSQRLKRTDSPLLKNCSPEARARFVVYGSMNQPGNWR